MIRINTSCVSRLRYCSSAEKYVSGLTPHGNIDIETRIRNDNSSVAEHVHSINSVMKERRTNGSSGSNRGELETNHWLALSRIKSPLNIPDATAKATTRKALILFSPRNISQTLSEKGKDEIRDTYPSDKQYI